MAKNNEAPKTHTVEEVDEQNAQAVIDGFAECYELLDGVVLQLQKSVEDVHAVYYLGNAIGKKRQQIDELQAVMDALSHLRDMMNSEYFEKLDELGAACVSYADLRESLRL